MLMTQVPHLKAQRWAYVIGYIKLNVFCKNGQGQWVHWLKKTSSFSSSDFPVRVLNPSFNVGGYLTPPSLPVLLPSCLLQTNSQRPQKLLSWHHYFLLGSSSMIMKMFIRGTRKIVIENTLQHSRYNIYHCPKRQYRIHPSIFMHSSHCQPHSMWECPGSNNREYIYIYIW